MKRYTELKRFIRQSQRGEWCRGRWVSDVEEIETLQGRWCLISRDRGDNKAGLDLLFNQICILQKKKIYILLPPIGIDIFYVTNKTKRHQ